MQLTKRAAVSLALVVISAGYVVWQRALPELPVALLQLSPLKLLAIAAALTLSLFIAGQRLSYASRDFGFPVSYRDAMAATSIGGLAGYVLFQIVGQIAGRSAALRRSGVSVDAIAVVTLYERAVALGVLAVAAFAGAIYLFGRVSIDIRAGGAGLLQASAGFVVTTVAVAAVAWRDLLIVHVLPLLQWNTLRRIARLAVFTVLIQACTLIAYVLAVEQFQNSVPLLDLVAASSIVMFAAAIPISFSGWGVRELSAIAALGLVGVSPQHALVASVTIGLLSLATLAGVAYWATLYVWSPGKTAVVEAPAPASSRISDEIARGALALGVAWLVLFQIQVPLDRGPVNLSPADLLAVLCGLLLLFDLGKAPRMLFSGTAAFGLAGAVVFLVGYLHGLDAFGYSDWAATKFAGWFVLLSYGAAGSTLARWTDVGGANRLAVTLVTASAAIVVFSATAQFIYPYVDRLEGFAGNPNAFAFQILMSIAVSFALLRENRAWVPINTILIAGLVLAESRAGYITLGAMIVALAMLRPGNTARLAKATGFGITIALAISTALWLSGADATLTLRSVAQITAYDLERWRTVREGLELFSNQPLFGNGLGYYYRHFSRSDGEPLVIHSVPVWILAEFGLVGIATALAFAAAMLRRASDFAVSDGALLAILAGGAFGLFGLAHDIFYQRSFWLLLGAAVAMMPYRGNAQGRVAA